MFRKPFLGRTHISDGFPRNRIGALWATHIDRRDIESTVGTILALTTRAVKRYVLAASALFTFAMGWFKLVPQEPAETLWETNTLPREGQAVIYFARAIGHIELTADRLASEGDAAHQKPDSKLYAESSC